MTDKNVASISILTIRRSEESEMPHMFPIPTRIIANTQRVAIEELGNNLSQIVDMLHGAIDKIPKSTGDFAVESFTFALSVNGGGKISLIGELSAQLSSGITVTLKRQGHRHAESCDRKTA